MDDAGHRAAHGQAYCLGSLVSLPARGIFRSQPGANFRSNLRNENRGAKAQVKTEVKMEQPLPFAALFLALVLFFS